MCAGLPAPTWAWHHPDKAGKRGWGEQGEDGPMGGPAWGGGWYQDLLWVVPLLVPTPCEIGGGQLASAGLGLCFK